MESEYIETTNAAQEAIFLRKLYSSITSKPIDIAIKILTNSEAALKHVKNNVNHSRTKHIDTRYHYIHGLHAASLVELKYVPAPQQAADILTKPLGITKHLEAIKLLQLTIFPFKPHSARSDVHFSTFTLSLRLTYVFFSQFSLHFNIFIFKDWILQENKRRRHARSVRS